MELWVAIALIATAAASAGLVAWFARAAREDERKAEQYVSLLPGR